MALIINTKDKNAMCIKNVLELVGSQPSYANRVSNLPLGLSILCSIHFREGFLWTKQSGKLTVYFEEPFWVGVFERIEDGKTICGMKVTFGAEPKDYEVQEYIQKYYFSLEIQSGC